MKHIYRIKLILAFSMSFFSLSGQDDLSGTINIYTSVLNFETCEATLEVSDATGFEIGMEVLLIQMKGATVNTTNTSTFGAVEDIGSAGLYERNEIEAIDGNSITLRFTLENEYDLTGNLQLVSIPNYESATVNNTLTAQPWNGATGGVLVFEVANNLDISGVIDVSSRGFRGGQGSTTIIDSCSSVTFGGFISGFTTNLDNWRGAQKGEGIAAYVLDKESGRAALANGGGGGNDHKSGGGGGGHHAEGGQGGELDAIGGCNGVYPGIGGNRLLNESTRLFLGGGGGGGHGNQGNASDGGNGGGIVIIFANTISGNGIIRAIGQDASIAVGEGAGGGGAGGSILVVADEVTGLINLDASGGAGGDTDGEGLAACYGPGGGGAGGRVYATTGNNLIPNVFGGQAGVVTNSTIGTCNGTTNSATNGFPGSIALYEDFPESTTEISTGDIDFVQCGTTTSNTIQFLLNDSIATSFDYCAFINGSTDSLCNTISDASLTIDGLNPLDEVTLIVRAINPLGCFTAIDTVSCTTVACDSPAEVLTNIAPIYCIGETEVQLVAEPDDGFFTGTGVDSVGLFMPPVAGLGDQNLFYTYTDTLGCTYTDTLTTTVVASAAQPTIECTNESANEVTFSWTDTGDRYQIVVRVNGFNTGIPTFSPNTTFTQTGLQPGDAVEIAIIAISDSGCGNSEIITQTCVASSCPDIPIAFEDFPTQICQDEPSLQLVATPVGGIFSGEGIDSSGLFNPNLVDLLTDESRVVTLRYQFQSDVICPIIEDSILVTVSQPPLPPLVSCDVTTTSSVSFVWSHPTATNFNVTYQVSNDSPVTIENTTDRNITIDDLPINASVSISVEAISENGCGNSLPALAECVANPCFNDDIVLLGLDSAYCVNAGAVQLTAIPPNGTFLGEAVDANGLFRPSEATVGTNTIIYEVIEGDCVFRDTAFTEVQDLPVLPNVQCFVSKADRIVYTWSHPLATEFEYTYEVNDTEIFGPFTTTDTIIIIRDLEPETEVTVTLRALDAGACGSSQFISSSCTTLPCSNNPPSIDNLDDTYCINTPSFNLLGTPDTGIFIINNDTTDLFIPDSIGVGIVEVTYFLVDTLNCVQSSTRAVEIVDAPPLPQISCADSTAQSLTFAWDNPNELVYTYDIIVDDAIVLTDTTNLGEATFGGLTPADSASISLRPFGIEACEVVAVTQTCRTILCDTIIAATFNIDSTYCLDSINFEISATPAGGIFSGAGVDISGTFNPSIAGVGATTITYDFLDERGCPFQDTFITEVLTAPEPPIVSCGENGLDFTTFNWTHPDENAIFTYTLATNPLPNITDENTLIVNDLLPNQAVNLQIRTLGDNGCGDSETIEFACFAAPCDTITLQVTPVDPVCLGLDNPPQELIVNIPDSVNLVSAIWSGDGIINSFDGIFDPTSGSLELGFALVTFEGRDSLGCPYLARTDIPINEQPNANAGLDQILNCQTPMIELSQDEAGNFLTAYQWSTVEGEILTNSFSVTVDSAGAYVLEVANGACVNTDTVVVTSNIVFPVADAGIDQLIFCSGDLVTLNGTSSSIGEEFIYQWTGPNDFQANQITTSTTQIGTYQLIVTDTTNFCTSTPAIVEVVDRIEPLAANIELTGQDVLDCTDPALMLDGSASVYSGELDYQWLNADSILLSPFSTDPTIDVNEAGTYTLVVRSENGCLDTTQFNLQANFEPTTANAGQDQIIGCAAILNLNGTVPSDSSVFTFEWSGVGLIDAPNTLNPRIDEQGLYVLTVNNTQNGCVVSDTVQITIEENSIQELLATPIPPSCAGDTDGRIRISEPVGGTSPYVYSIDNGTFTENMLIENLAPGTYQITAEDARGCTFEIAVEVQDRPPLAINIEDQTIKLGQSAFLEPDFSDTGVPILDFIWSVEKEELCSGCPFISISPQRSLEVLIEVTDLNGCTASDFAQVIVERTNLLYVPNAFSPNGDAENDYFNLFAGNALSEVANLKIYDRWGEIVFEQDNLDFNNPQSGWDGNYKGEPMNPGVYIYVAQVIYVDGSRAIEQGEFTLLR